MAQSTLANLILKLSGDPKDLVKALETSEKRASRFADNAGKSIKKFGAVAGKAMLAGGAAVGGLGIVAGKMAMDFEKSFAEVATLLPDLDKGGIAKLRKDVLAFAKETGTDAADAVGSLYQAISAGVAQDNAIDFLRTSSAAAIGGVTNLETAVDGMTSVMNAYGRETLSAQKASDIMFTAVKLGKTDFEQLSRRLFNVIPTAASLGVSFEDVAASIAVMTAQGVPTSVATTQMRQAFVELSKTGTKLSDGIRDLTDKSFTDLIAEGKTSSQIMNELRASMNDQEFRNLFSSVEAMNAALSLTGPNAVKVDAAMAEMTKSAGATNTAFETVADTTGFKMQKAINGFKIQMIDVGMKLLPMITEVLSKFVIPALDKFSNWFTTNETQIRSALDKIVDGGKVLFGAFKSGLEGIAPLVKGFFNFILDNKIAMIAAVTLIGGAIAAALGPFGLAALAITGMITAFGFLRDNWGEINEGMRKIFDKVWTGMTKAFKGYINIYISGMNFLIRGLNRIKFTTPSWIPSLGGKSFGFDIPTIPKLARGTSNFAGGAAIVGERGPELVNLPRSSQVFPAGQTASMLGGTTIIINNPQIIGEIQLEQTIRQAVARAERTGATPRRAAMNG